MVMKFLFGYGFVFLCWTWNFGHGKFCWACNFGHGNFWTCDFGHGNFFLDMWWWVTLMLDQTFFCRTIRAEVAFKCWKAYGKYCLQILRTSSMKLAFKLFSKLYWIRKLMSTRIFSYFLPCQNDFGIPRAHSIFQALVKWCWRLTTSLSLQAWDWAVKELRSMIPSTQKRLRVF